ncbi:MAG: hypothetical protein HGA45_39720 [Chloroflexales bacterium]|nr:hypothetical protein [Chloroflexales bacterium]
MNALILIGLVAAVLLAAIGRMVAPQPQPPQIIYVQATPMESTGGAGCLPLLILVGVILLAVIGLR